MMRIPAKSGPEQGSDLRGVVHAARDVGRQANRGGADLWCQLAGLG